MPAGAITSYFDVAQVTLYAFWIFFAGLILYLRREDKREGYPLDSDHSTTVRVEGFPPTPKPKVFLLPHGGIRTAPHDEAVRHIAARASALWPGAPMVPTGNPLIDGVGPASYALREDEAEMGYEDGLPRLIPMRDDAEYTVSDEDPDPRGMEVFGADRLRAGVVADVWVDRLDRLVRYLEVELDAPLGRRVLVPMTMLDIKARRRRVVVGAIMSRQFADVPGLRLPDRVTKLEEDRIMGYFGGGAIYAEPSRQEPLI